MHWITISSQLYNIKIDLLAVYSSPLLEITSRWKPLITSMSKSSSRLSACLKSVSAASARVKEVKTARLMYELGPLGAAWYEKTTNTLGPLRAVDLEHYDVKSDFSHYRLGVRFAGRVDFFQYVGLIEKTISSAACDLSFTLHGPSHCGSTRTTRFTIAPGPFNRWQLESHRQDQKQRG